MHSWPLLGQDVGLAGGDGINPRAWPSSGVAAGSRELTKGRKKHFGGAMRQLIFEFGGLAAPPALSVPSTVLGAGIWHVTLHSGSGLCPWEWREIGCRCDQVSKTGSTMADPIVDGFHRFFLEQ